MRDPKDYAEKLIVLNGWVKAHQIVELAARPTINNGSETRFWQAVLAEINARRDGPSA
jgi:hypothetical protein